jgi:flagellar export protein FliJ
VKAFRFPLQRVQDLRALQLRAEEEKLAVLQLKLASLIQRENALTETLGKFRLNLLASPSILGSDLQALAACQVRIRNEQKSLRESRAGCETLLADQRQRLLKARINYRVLEKLKEKRWKEWSYLSDREVEDTASEAYTAKWPRPDTDR